MNESESEKLLTKISNNMDVDDFIKQVHNPFFDFNSYIKSVINKSKNTIKQNNMSAPITVSNKEIEDVNNIFDNISVNIGCQGCNNPQGFALKEFICNSCNRFLYLCPLCEQEEHCPHCEKINQLTLNSNKKLKTKSEVEGIILPTILNDEEL